MPSFLQYRSATGWGELGYLPACHAICVRWWGKPSLEVLQEAGEASMALMQQHAPAGWLSNVFGLTGLPDEALAWSQETAMGRLPRHGVQYLATVLPQQSARYGLIEAWIDTPGLQTMEFTQEGAAQAWLREQAQRRALQHGM